MFCGRNARLLESGLRLGRFNITRMDETTWLATCEYFWICGCACWRVSSMSAASAACPSRQRCLLLQLFW